MLWEARVTYGAINNGVQNGLVRCLSRSVKGRLHIDAFGDFLFTFKFQLLFFVSQGSVVLYQPATEFLPMIDKV